MANGAKIAQYGTWDSPIPPNDFADEGVVLDQVDVNQSNGKIYLLENRPAEGGRGCIVEYSKDGSKDVLPKQYNALTQVHEYGGASYVTRDTDGHLIFSDFATKLLFDLDPETQEVTPIVEEDPKIYFADFTVHPKDSKWILAIKEDHHPPKIEDIKTTLVAIDSSRKAVHTLVKGADFYTYPRFSPDGSKVCWVQWNFPEMPWTASELWVADWHDGQIANARSVAGKDVKESITQPRWNFDDSLFFVSFRSGYYQLYHLVEDHVHHVTLKGLEEAEFGAPDWRLGSSTYAPLTSRTLIAFYDKDGAKNAIVVDVETSTYTDPHFPIVDLNFNCLKRTSDTSFVVIGSTRTVPTSLFHLDITKASQTTILKESVKINFSEAYFSLSSNIRYPRIYGPGGGDAYGLFLPPRNPKYVGPKDTLPPLIVAMHGGPTYQTGPKVNMRDQFWTTRGYSVVQVNYVGSAGYGRDYMKLLDCQWGVSDIADAASCVHYLAEKKLIDPNRVGITGHSAGGYATMQSLCMYPDLFAAGISESGVSDMQALFDETHKFESQYMQPLLFSADSSPEDRKRIIRERSPIYLTERIKAPMLILSGGDDQVVPPNQASLMADKIREGGGVVELKVYEGEGHGFVKGETLKDMEVRRERWFAKYLLGQ